jgi:2-oxo-4-hydroxy-4-carboxy-5-ureidoimidazoline decarboxylase
MEPWLRLDRATPEDARERLRMCCGSTQWVERMLARRPFGGRDALLGAARQEWYSLSHDDWREAFAHHPKIGDRESLRQRLASTRQLSAREQAGVPSASDDVLDALAEGNRAYEQRYGFIFIVCATGRRADEMLALLRERLTNDAETEIRIAADEQARITELRLLAVQ